DNGTAQDRVDAALAPATDARTTRAAAAISTTPGHARSCSRSLVIAPRTTSRTRHARISYVQQAEAGPEALRSTVRPSITERGRDTAFTQLIEDSPTRLAALIRRVTQTALLPLLTSRMHSSPDGVESVAVDELSRLEVVIGAVVAERVAAVPVNRVVELAR
ncbi:MAG: hypothetical protein ACREMY_14895, partial [bacterium]